MKKVILITVVLVALGGVVTASLLQTRSRGRGTKVYMEEVARRDITQVVKASGQIDPRIKVNLSAHVIAKIERLYVEEGDEVEAGQPVLDLEKEAFLAVRDRAAAQLRIARTQLRRAEVDLRDAERKQKRSLRLAAEGIISPERREDADLRLASAQLAREQAQEEIARVQADLKKAQDDLAKVTLYAPISGRVIALNAEEGEVVVSGTMNNAASVIATIADLSEILAEVDVDETEVVHVEIGQTGKIIVDALPDEAYRSRVVEVGSSGFHRPQQRDVTFFKVKLLLESPDHRLRPGMSARAEIDVATRGDALVLPIQSVVYRQPLDEAEAPLEEDDEVQVVLVVEDGKAVQRPVEVGIADATDIEIVGGVETGETVVTGPYRTLKKLEDGDAVELRKTKSRKTSKAKDDDEEESDD